MNPNITNIIDRYLTGELSQEDHAAFEEKMEESASLRSEVQLQQAIMEGITRNHQRSDIQKIAKRYHAFKAVKWIGLSVIAIAAIAVSSYLVLSANSHSGEEQEQSFDLKETVAQELNALKYFENVAVELFTIPANGSVVLSNSGVLLSVPEQAFLKDGVPYSGKVIVHYQEARNGSDIVKSGLSTTAGDQLLQTQGMFSVQGFTADGEPLAFNPKVGVYVQVPVEEHLQNMQLFDGITQKDGTIDWQNPEKLVKIPVPVDMSELDFYPPGYENKLDVLKWKKSKTSRDSLYLSFEEFNNVVQNEQINGKFLFENNCAPCHLPHKNSTGPKLANVRAKWRKGGANENSIYQWVNNWQDAITKDQYALDVSRLTPTAMRTFPHLTRDQIDAIFDYVDNRSTNVSNEPEAPRIQLFPIEQDEELKTALDVAAVDSSTVDRISPSKVLAFWNKKFNNTNLATREFETRMRAIHTTCNDQVLEKYTKNLKKPISEIDQEVVSMGYSTFQKFVEEGVGVVNPNNPHIAGLQKFYEQGIDALKKRNKTYQNLDQKKRDKWDKKTDELRRKEQQRTAKRNVESFEEEYKYNLDNVYKQLGYSKGFTLKRASGSAISSVKAGPAIKNIDAYVRKATANRSSATLVDPITGKTAQLTYNKFTFNVENPSQYIKLYAYLFPHELKSYQRIDGMNGKFEYPLNNGILYDVAVVGITEKGYAYFQKQTIRSGELGTISLEPLSEAKLEASIEQLNRKRISRPTPIGEELKWLFREKADYKEQQVRKQMRQFREEVANVLFPCYSFSETEHAPISKPFGI